MIVNDFDLTNSLNDKYNFYIFFDNIGRYFYILDIIKNKFINYNCLSINISDFFNIKNLFIEEPLLLIIYFDKFNEKIFIKTKASLKDGNIKNKYIFIYRDNIKKVDDNFSLVIVFYKLTVQFGKKWIIQYFKLSNYDINNVKLNYIADIYKNNINEFMEVFTYIKKTNKYNETLFNMKKFLLMKKNIKIFSVKDLIFNIKNRNKEQALYIYKLLKKNVIDHTLLLYMLYKETSYEDSVMFNLSKLDNLVKNGQIKQFWIELFKEINFLMLNNDLTQQEMYL